MGSSPFTATISPSPLDAALQASLGSLTPGLCQGLLVAFSGGTDSTALLAALATRARHDRFPLAAAHFDHRLDPDSSTRAQAAAKLAEALGVPYALGVADQAPPRGESLEAWARRQRYAFLHREADRRGLYWIATAHHADDQAETLLLRWLFGSGLVGLRGIQPRRGRLLRPLLTVRQETLARALVGPELEPLDDPTNRDLRHPRNRIRHHLLPQLLAEHPDLVERLAALATTAQRSLEGLDRRLGERLDLGPGPGPPSPMAGPGPNPAEGASCRRSDFEALPSELRPLALALLTRTAGAEHPVPTAAARELDRQLATGRRVALDAGQKWRLSTGGGRLRLAQSKPSPGRFAYTGTLPEPVEVPELGCRLCFDHTAPAPWMFRGWSDRAGITDLPVGSQVIVRNRRPGDRIRPLGSGRRRRLKELLIDQGVPRWQRDRLPLLVVDGEIAWIPGVTIGDRFRLGDNAASAWAVSIEDL